MIMSRSSSERRRSSCRWSEAILRRRCATAPVESDSSTPSADSVESPVSRKTSKTKSLLPVSVPTSQPVSLIRSCSCRHRCQEATCGWKSTLLASPLTGIKGIPSLVLKTERIHERLRRKIRNSQGEDIVDSARQSSLQSSLHRIKSVLSFVTHYSQCLELQQSASLQLYHLISNILPTPSVHLADLLKIGMCRDEQKLDNIDVSLLKDVAEQATFVLGKCDKLTEFQDDYKTKRNDFLLASKNFCLILGNVEVTNGQLKKLESQYNDILLRHKKSQTVVEDEMSKVINSCKELPSESFKNLSRWLEQLEKRCTHMTMLFSCLGEELQLSSSSIFDSPSTDSIKAVPAAVPTDTSACGEPGSAIASCKFSACPDHCNAENTQRKHRLNNCS